MNVSSLLKALTFAELYKTGIFCLEVLIPFIIVVFTQLEDEVFFPLMGGGGKAFCLTIEHKVV